MISIEATEDVFFLIENKIKLEGEQRTKITEFIDLEKYFEEDFQAECGTQTEVHHKEENTSRQMKSTSGRKKA